MQDEPITLRVSRRDAGRLLVVVRERTRKLQRGVTKFAENFDPIKGQNMVEGLAAYKALEAQLEDQMK